MSYVFENRAVKKTRILLDSANATSELTNVKFADVDTVKEYVTFQRIIKSATQSSNCRLAASGLTDNSGVLIGWDAERYLL